MENLQEQLKPEKSGLVVRYEFDHSFQLDAADIAPALEKVLNKHANVFSDWLGTLKNIKARLHPKGDAKPRFWKARPLAFARKPAVDEALRKLEGEGVIKKVETSEWVAPIVTSVEKDGIARTCGDFKVTVNPQLEIDEYPLLCTNAINASLGGGSPFSVLDVSSCLSASGAGK